MAEGKIVSNFIPDVAHRVVNAAGEAIGEIMSIPSHRRAAKAQADIDILKEARQYKDIPIKGMDYRDRIFRVKVTAENIRSDAEYRAKKAKK